ncbi:MAG: hypothetical protein AAGM36_16160 [Cyanobacteria bacterium J06597_1]
MLEIVSIKPPDPKVVALKQAQAKSTRSENQKNSENAPAHTTTEASENTTKPSKRKLLPGNGLHSWRARLVAQVIAIEEEKSEIQFHLKDGLKIWLKRHYRIPKKRWREVSIGSYYKLSFYPWMRNKGSEFYSGCVYKIFDVSKNEFSSSPEEWHLLGYFTGNVFIVERDVTRVPQDKPPRRTAILPQNLKKYSGLRNGCYHVPVCRSGNHLSLTKRPLLEPIDGELITL